jgi:hypothetical protein
VEHRSAQTGSHERTGLHPKNRRFECAIAPVPSDSLNGAWGFTEWASTWLPATVLLGMTLAMMIVLLIALKRRDPV